MSDRLQMSQPRIVCVLGVHRSGTSIAARLLNLLGVDLGAEEHLMVPNEYNPKGYWEHQRIADLNDEILARLGGSWHELPTFSPGWESMPALADLRQRARALISRDFSAAPLWGWKDPRTCVTLPFWQRLLSPMEYVICVRNPVDVARSLHHRDGFSFEKGVNLWITHMQSVLDHTAGARRLFLIYEDMLERWPEELARLACFLGRPELAERAEIQAVVKAFVDDALHHHRTVLIDAMDESALAFPAKALYLVLRLYVSLSRDVHGLRKDNDQMLQEAIDRFGLYASTAQAETQSLRTQGPELEQQFQVLRAQVAEREQTVQTLSAQVAEREQTVQTLSAQVAEREQQVAGQRYQVQQLQVAKIALEAEVGQLQHHLEMVFNSLSWKLTASLRRIHAGLRTLNKRPGSSWQRVRYGFQVLRELWYRTAYTMHYSFNVLPPTLVEYSGSYDPKKTIRWIPSVQIDHQVKHACVMHAPSRATYRLMVPPRAVFRTFVALLPEVWGRNPSGVEFTVTVSPRGSGRLLTCKRWSHPTHFPHHRRWLELQVPLDRFANQEVEFTLATSGTSEDYAQAIWGDPVVVLRRHLLDIWSLGVGYLRLHGLRGLLARMKTMAFSHDAAIPIQQSEPDENTYEAWLRPYSALTDENRRCIRQHVDSLNHRPLISIITVVSDSHETSLRAAIESVRHQLYDNWELWLADSSSEPQVARILDEYCRQDSRIQRFLIDPNLDKEEIYTKALAYCRGEYTVLLLDADLQRPFDWLLGVFVLWSVNRLFPPSFPILYKSAPYDYLIHEKFPFNETALSRQLRALPQAECDPVIRVGDSSRDMPARSEPQSVLQQPDTKAIAFYLPQFHPIPENDRWWGAGFTEWTNVKRAKPFFKYHYQPRIPGDLGYYDLRDPQVRQHQAELAKEYGLHGFCYYHYRFGKGRRLLERPFNEVLQSGQPDFPFCLYWANENWTRRWDGLEHEILMEQIHSQEDDMAFIEELLPAFYDPRYIKVNGRPLLIVYRPTLLPDPKKTYATWREVARANGLPDLYLAGVQSFGWFEDPRGCGLDAAMEHPVFFRVHGYPDTRNCQVRDLDPDFKGTMLSYFHIKRYGMTREKPNYPLFKCVMPMWDNSARRLNRSTVYHTNDPVPENYYEWLAHVADYTRVNFAGDERLIFINAWNEWAEGCYLEPDKYLGHSLLRATRLALTQIGGRHNMVPLAASTVENEGGLEIIFVSHDAARAGAQRLLLTLIQWLRDSKGVRPKIILRRGGVLTQEFHRLGPVLNIEPFLQSGPDSLASAVRGFCGQSASLIYINTLVPGDLVDILTALKVPIITHIHEMEYVIQRALRQKAFLKEHLEQLLRSTTHIIAASPPVAHNLETNHAVPASKITTIYAFIQCSDSEPTLVDKAALRQKMGLHKDKTLIFGCGTTDWRKGPDLFIEVARHVVSMGVEDVHFYWIGAPLALSERDELETKIRNLGLESYVTFLGEVPTPRSYFPAGDLFLLTSREDPFPLVCLEAADCGLPIICFEKAGGMPDFVQRDAGYVVPFGNTQDMADTLVSLCAHPEQRHRMGARACEKVRRHHDVSVAGEQIWQTILQFISTSCSQHSTPRQDQPPPIQIRNRPKVSIIVPNYNHAPYLRQRLDSVVGQEFQDVEVIILDDASTDNSRDIIASYQGNPKVRCLFNERNSGSAFKQWQKGLDEAGGEYIWFAESDDYASPQFLSKLVPLLDNHPAVGLAYCQSYLVCSDGRISGDNLHWTEDLDSLRWQHDFINDGPAEIKMFLSKKNTIPNASAVLLRKSILESAGIETSFRLCGDWFLWIKMLLYSDIAYIAEPLNYWGQHSSHSRNYPPGVLEWKEGELILRYVADQLELPEVETNKILLDFLRRCWNWQNDPLLFKPTSGEDVLHRLVRNAENIA